MGQGGTMLGILVLTPKKIKPVEIVWANSRHSEVQKRFIKFNHLHAKNESYLHTLTLNPSSRIRVSLRPFVLSHCSCSCKNCDCMLSLGDPNLTTKTVSAVIPIVVLLLVRAKTSSTRYTDVLRVCISILVKI